MSHFTEIKTQIKDTEALRLACQKAGNAFVSQGHTIRFLEWYEAGKNLIPADGTATGKSTGFGAGPERDEIHCNAIWPTKVL